MKSFATALIAALAAFAALAALGGPALADITITENNKTVAIDCAKDGEILLVGNNIKVTATGVCGKLTISGNHAKVTGSAQQVVVSGNHNAVTLAAADDVLVSGNNNTVTVAKAVKLPAPRISNPGNDNTVKQPK